MAREVPQERYGEFVTWLISLTSLDDRETMTRIWRQAMPPTAFAGIASLIQAAVGNDWVKLNERVPELKAFAKPQGK